MNVVILAGGLGTRFKELSVYPKILLPTPSGKTILEEQLEYFKNDNVTLVINDKFFFMTKQFLEVNDININLISSLNTNGSGNTLAAAYREWGDSMPKKNVMFFWSDILFEKEPTFYRPSSSDSCVIYTVDDKAYRYKYENGHIVNHDYEYDGNVPGIFWISDVSKVIPPKPVDKTMDLVDFLKDGIESSWITNVKEYKIEDNKIIEYRSLEDYFEIMKDVDFGEFASSHDIISYQDGKIIATNNGQADWYDLMKSLGLGEYCVKTNKDGDSIDMSECDKMNTISCEDYRDINPYSLNKCLDNFHSIYKKVDVYDGIEKHELLYKDQPRKVMSEIFDLILDDSYAEGLISKGYEYIINHSKLDEMVLSHGDISSSTLMWQWNANNTYKTYKLVAPTKNIKDKFYPKSYDDGCALMIEAGVWSLRKNDVVDYGLLHQKKLNAIAGLLISISRLGILKGNVIAINVMYDKIINTLKELLKCE